MKILVFEPDFRGHQAEYVDHLVKHLCDEDLPVELLLLVAPELLERTRRLQDLNGGNPRVQVHLLTSREAKTVSRGNLVSRDWQHWSVLQARVEEARPDHVLSLKLDHQQFSLGLGRRLPIPGHVSGILFRPAVHYPDPGNQGKSVRDTVRDLRKHLFYRALLTNPLVGTVFSLDERFPGYARRNYPNGNKVVALSDPVMPAPPDHTGLQRYPALTHKEAGRSTFLLFGSLSARKGVLQLIDALGSMPEESLRRMTVQLVGRVQETDRQKILTRIHALRARQPVLDLRLVDEFVSSGVLSALVERSDVVLAPYQRAVGSSGLIYWAAGAGRPIITQDYGLIGSLVRSHRLGLAVDTTDPSAIADALTRYCDRPEGIPFSEESARQLAARHTPRRFAETIFREIFRQPKIHSSD